MSSNMLKEIVTAAGSQGPAKRKQQRTRPQQQQRPKKHQPSPARRPEYCPSDKPLTSTSVAASDLSLPDTTEFYMSSLQRTESFSRHAASAGTVAATYEPEPTDMESPRLQFIPVDHVVRGSEGGKPEYPQAQQHSQLAVEVQTPLHTPVVQADASSSAGTSVLQSFKRAASSLAAGLTRWGCLGPPAVIQQEPLSVPALHTAPAAVECSISSSGTAVQVSTIVDDTQVDICSKTCTTLAEPLAETSKIDTCSKVCISPAPPSVEAPPSAAAKALPLAAPSSQQIPVTTSVASSNRGKRNIGKPSNTCVAFGRHVQSPPTTQPQWNPPAAVAPARLPRVATLAGKQQPSPAGKPQSSRHSNASSSGSSSCRNSGTGEGLVVVRITASGGGSSKKSILAGPCHSFGKAPKGGSLYRQSFTLNRSELGRNSSAGSVCRTASSVGVSRRTSCSSNGLVQMQTPTQTVFRPKSYVAVTHGGTSQQQQQQQQRQPRASRAGSSCTASPLSTTSSKTAEVVRVQDSQRQGLDSTSSTSSSSNSSEAVTSIVIDDSSAHERQQRQDSRTTTSAAAAAAVTVMAGKAATSRQTKNKNKDSRSNNSSKGAAAAAAAVAVMVMTREAATSRQRTNNDSSSNDSSDSSAAAAAAAAAAAVLVMAGDATTSQQPKHTDSSGNDNSQAAAAVSVMAGDATTSQQPQNKDSSSSNSSKVAAAAASVMGGDETTSQQTTNKDSSSSDNSIAAAAVTTADSAISKEPAILPQVNSCPSSNGHTPELACTDTAAAAAATAANAAAAADGDKQQQQQQRQQQREDVSPAKPQVDAADHDVQQYQQRQEETVADAKLHGAAGTQADMDCSTTGSSRTGSSTTGSSMTGSSATGSSTIDSSTIGSSTTGSSTTGSSTTGSSTTGSSTTGSRTVSELKCNSPNITILKDSGCSAAAAAIGYQLGACHTTPSKHASLPERPATSNGFCNSGSRPASCNSSSSSSTKRNTKNINSSTAPVSRSWNGSSRSVSCDSSSSSPKASSSVASRIANFNSRIRSHQDLEHHAVEQISTCAPIGVKAESKPSTVGDGISPASSITPIPPPLAAAAAAVDAVEVASQICAQSTELPGLDAVVGGQYLESGRWHLVRVSQAAPCAAQDGTVPMKTVNGDLELFQCNTQLQPGSLAAACITAASSSSSGKTDRSDPAGADADRMLQMQQGASSSSSGSSSRVWLFCPDPLCLLSRPPGSDALPEWSWHVDKLPGVQLSQQEAVELQNIGMVAEEAKLEN